MKLGMGRQNHSVRRGSQCRANPSALNGQHLFGFEISRHHDLQHFHIVVVANFPVTDFRPLVNTGPGLEPDGALTFVLKFNSAFENIDQLKGGLVQVCLT
jgi:hypothetical protein